MSRVGAANSPCSTRKSHPFRLKKSRFVRGGEETGLTPSWHLTRLGLVEALVVDHEVAEIPAETARQGRPRPCSRASPGSDRSGPTSRLAVEPHQDLATFGLCHITSADSGTSPSILRRLRSRRALRRPPDGPYFLAHREFPSLNSPLINTSRRETEGELPTDV